MLPPTLCAWVARAKSRNVESAPFRIAASDDLSELKE
jgi:hypothetical protein